MSPSPAGQWKLTRVATPSFDAPTAAQLATLAIPFELPQAAQLCGTPMRVVGVRFNRMMAHCIAPRGQSPTPNLLPAADARSIGTRSLLSFRDVLGDPE